MIISLFICIASFLIVATMLLHRMYSNAEVKREIVHAEVVMGAIGKNTVAYVQGIDKKKLQQAYHWILVKIEDTAHIIVARLKRLF